MLLLPWDGAINEEGALGLSRALPAGMWMGYSQPLPRSGEETLPGSPGVMLPEVAQSRALCSEPPEAEMGRGFGGDAREEAPWGLRSPAVPRCWQEGGFLSGWWQG